MSEIDIGIDVGEAIVADVAEEEAAATMAGSEDAAALEAGGRDAEALFSETDGAGGEIGAGEGQGGFGIEFGDTYIDDSGDASDDDLDEAAQEAADEAKQLVRSANSNNGMEALAELIDDEIDTQAEGMVDGNPPDINALFGAIQGVHSSGTAQSCMTEGISAAYDLLMQAFQAMQAHEAAEGKSF